MHSDIWLILMNFLRKILMFCWKIYQRNGNTVRMITHAQATQLNTLARQLTVQKNSSEKDEVLAYDYLVLANGCSYKSPYIKPNNNSLSMTPDARQDELQEFYQRVFSPENDHVVIVGGGSLGIQLAGELVDLNHYRKQNNIAPFKITLVHSRQMLRDRSNSEIAHFNIPIKEWSSGVIRKKGHYSRD